jgi:hypothetical protein
MDAHYRGSEFGRTPMIQSAGQRSEPGATTAYSASLRCSPNRCRAGTTRGATDDFGHRAVDKRVHPRSTCGRTIFSDSIAANVSLRRARFQLTDGAGKVLRVVRVQAP